MAKFKPKATVEQTPTATMFNVYVGVEGKRELTRIANENGTKVSSFVRQCIAYCLRELGEDKVADMLDSY